MTMSLKGSKIVTFLIAAVLLIVASFVKADSNVKPQMHNPTFNHQMSN